MPASTMKDLPSILVEYLATARGDGDFAAKDISYNGRSLHVAPLPLTDVSGARVGSLVIIMDMTSLRAVTRASVIGVALACLVVGLGLLILFQRIIGRVEKRVRVAIRGLANSNADLEQVAHVTSNDLQEAVQGLATTVESFRQCSALGEKAGGSCSLSPILAGALRVQEISQNLEDYVDLGINLQTSPVALDAVVMAALEKLYPPVKASEVEIQLLPTLTTKPVLLARAIRRVIEASRISEQPSAAWRLIVSASEQGGEWSITFSDSGIGNTECRAAALTEAGTIAQKLGGRMVISASETAQRSVSLVLRPAK